MRVRRHLILAAAAAFTGEQHLLRTTVRCRGTFRDAQHELMDGGAAIELAGDALLADAQRMDFLAANLAIRQPRGVAGVAIKNAGRAIADAGAKFRHKGGLELAGGTTAGANGSRLGCPAAVREHRLFGAGVGYAGLEGAASGSVFVGARVTDACRAAVRRDETHGLQGLRAWIGVAGVGLQTAARLGRDEALEAFPAEAAVAGLVLHSARVRIAGIRLHGYADAVALLEAEEAGAALASDAGLIRRGAGVG